MLHIQQHLQLFAHSSVLVGHISITDVLATSRRMLSTCCELAGWVDLVVAGCPLCHHCSQTVQLGSRGERQGQRLPSKFSFCTLQGRSIASSRCHIRLLRNLVSFTRIHSDIASTYTIHTRLWNLPNIINNACACCLADSRYLPGLPTASYLGVQRVSQ